MTDYAVTITDSAGVTDAMTDEGTYHPVFTDGAGVSDQVTWLVDLLRTITDQVSIMDSMTATTARNYPFRDKRGNVRPTVVPRTRFYGSN